MDAELWKRLGYPRRLKDGSFAVTSGFFGDRYRLTAKQFEHYVDGYARPWYIDALTEAGFAIGMFSLFVIPREAGLGSLLICIAPGLLLWILNAYKRAMLFLTEFRPVRPVQVLDHPWSGYELCAAANRNRNALVWGACLLLLGRMTADAFPHSLMQFSPVFEWPAYVYLAGICLTAGVLLLGMQIHYKATRGCRLTVKNIERTEGGAAFLLKA